MSTKHVRTVADLVRFGAGLKIDCLGCGYSRSFDGIELARIPAAGTGPLREIASRLKCSRCGARGDAHATILPPIGEPRGH